ncbi:hypothetical protein JW711_05625 [Candidatus Woesearchaeota archaeon]|nr:hypothetical protein [Candidatus Woesearchaeota archaeon]
MKAILSYVLAALLIVSSASAIQQLPPSTMDADCAELGYDFAVAQWDYMGSSYVKIDEAGGYTTNVVGDNQEANWTSSTSIAGVIVATANETHDYNGVASSETVEADGIAKITMCGRAPSSPGDGITGSHNLIGPGAGVPEFSTLTLGAAVALGLLGVLYLRKH